MEARITWTTEAGDEVELPAETSGEVSADAVTLVVRYIPGEGAYSLADSFSSTEVSVEGNTVVITDADISALSGCYFAQARFSDGESNIRLSLPFLISVGPDLFESTVTRALTIEDLRMFLHDRMASENVVEGAQEFPDRLLYDAMCQAVRTYNQTPPEVEFKNVRTMPSHMNFMEGAAAYAFNAKAKLLSRNRLAVPGQADAEQRAGLYLELAGMYRRRYLTWVSETKRCLDADDGWGTA